MCEWEIQQEWVEKEKVDECEKCCKNQEVLKKEKKRKGLLEFWLKYVYNVCIIFDVNLYMFMLFCWNLVMSEIEFVKVLFVFVVDGEGSIVYCDLLFLYVIILVFWVLSYDMQFNIILVIGIFFFDV